MNAGDGSTKATAARAKSNAVNVVAAGNSDSLWTSRMQRGERQMETAGVGKTLIILKM